MRALTTARRVQTRSNALLGDYSDIFGLVRRSRITHEDRVSAFCVVLICFKRNKTNWRVFIYTNHAKLTIIQLDLSYRILMDSLVMYPIGVKI